MWKMRSTLTQLNKLSKKFYRRYRSELKDIIVFGSVMRGKSDPKDLDVLMLFKKKINKDIEYEFRKIASDVKNAAIISKTENNYTDTSFDAREGVLFEGYSLIKNKLVSSEYGFTPLGLFVYQTQTLSNVKKTRFYYALNGRAASKGIVDMLDGLRLSDNLIAFPLNKIEAAKEFFNFWELEYKYVPVLMPERLARKNIIGKR